MYILRLAKGIQYIQKSKSETYILLLLVVLISDVFLAPLTNETFEDVVLPSNMTCVGTDRMPDTQSTFNSSVQLSKTTARAISNSTLLISGKG